MDKEITIHNALLSMARYDRAVTQIQEAVHTLQQENWTLRNALLSLRDIEQN